MGQDVAPLVAAGRGLHDLHTGQGETVFLDGRHGLFADILRHDEVVDVGKRLQLHLIVDAAQHPLPVERISLQLVILHQLFHHVVGRGILLQPQIFLDGGEGALVAGAFGGGEGIVPRAVRLPDEQGIVPVLPVGFQQLHDPLEHPVQILVSHQQLAEHHVVACGAGGDPSACTVHDVAAGRGDGKVVVGGIGGLRPETVAVDQLQKDQAHPIQSDDDRGNGDQHHHPAGHRLVFVRVHPFSFRRGVCFLVQTTPLSILNSSRIRRTQPNSSQQTGRDIAAEGSTTQRYRRSVPL